jgi:hypothetical protein
MALQIFVAGDDKDKDDNEMLIGFPCMMDLGRNGVPAQTYLLFKAVSTTTNLSSFARVGHVCVCVVVVV